MNYAIRQAGNRQTLLADLQAAYDKVKAWPENRMSEDAVSALGEGFIDLLALRNLVPKAIEVLADRRDGLLDFANFGGPKLNKEWTPDDQDLIYTALNWLDGEGDADEDCGQQLVERLLSAWRANITADSTN